MARPKTKPYTEMSLLEFQAHFPDEQSCWDYLGKMRWPEGLHCSKCQHATSCVLTRRNVLQCNTCNAQHSATAQTISTRVGCLFTNGFGAYTSWPHRKKGSPCCTYSVNLGATAARPRVTAYNHTCGSTHILLGTWIAGNLHYPVGVDRPSVSRDLRIAVDSQVPVNDGPREGSPTQVDFDGRGGAIAPQPRGYDSDAPIGVVIRIGIRKAVAGWGSGFHEVVVTDRD